MYLISVLVGRAQPLVWGLLFKDEHNALAALGRLREVGDIDVEDEHGQRLVAKGGDIGPIMFEDMALSKLAGVERTLHEQKIRAMCVKRMQTEAEFRGVVPASGGPGILTPMGTNGIGRG